MENNSRPCIVVVTDKPDKNILKQLLAGIEEEGIPYEVDVVNGDELLKITHKAAVYSRMGVGIGINQNRVLLHFSKLKVDKPILDAYLNDNIKDTARNIGNNAARLYKIMPFKNMDEGIMLALNENFAREDNI
ncbi:glycerol dehydratase reactivase beta/small subunit family protein [Clostridium estertheticum]|uniref:glycerol dehydratase reactivase beta/small subunit family protein n=1 Tax=Clostridium estertheticum TaxID=238834 RepID=UPI001C0CBA9C|nr:glycerol dehydratase reactivase beta/small subunit family protein [Clostridium estertheticum]MBU3178776.1 glycerol dehydratase reactivase beta/small subunit family protein [Clostridium estertheticum]